MTTPVVRFTETSKHFGDVVALDRLTLDIHEGEIVGLLGPNGAGKTTTLRTLLGLMQPTSGSARSWASTPGATRSPPTATSPTSPATSSSGRS
jgi:ABC-2 type transport system ATP-binding protein